MHKQHQYVLLNCEVWFLLNQAVFKFKDTMRTQTCFELEIKDKAQAGYAWMKQQFIQDSAIDMSVFFIVD